MVRDPRHLQTGKPLERFGDMRPREMLANWLLCATFETIENRELMFYSDPIGGDGIIRDEATGDTWQTEHGFSVSLPLLNRTENPQALASPQIVRLRRREAAGSPTAPYFGGCKSP
jgi:hypothetical protein